MTALNLSKGQALQLTKSNGSDLTNITLGLGWTGIKSSGLFGLFLSEKSIDLDASCLVFDENKKLVHNVYFADRTAKGIRHLGDDRTGSDKKTESDNEQILIDLTNLKSEAKHLVFTINSYSGESFKKVESAYCRVLDDKGEEVVRAKLAEKGDFTAAIIAVISKENGKWTIKNVSKMANASVSSQLIDVAKSII